jgi:predicted ATPase
MNLTTLGRLRLEPSALRRPKPLLLLAYLALHGPTAKRDLAVLFFPESRDRADALATTLARLRQQGAPLCDRDKIVSTSVACDALAFKARLEAEAYSDALALYGGPFGHGLELALASELEEWLLAEREGLAAGARQAHLALAERALGAGDLAARQHGSSAYLLGAAPPLGTPEIARYYRLFTRTQSQLLPQLQREADELGVPLPKPREDTPHNLPLLLTRFLGRDMERLELARAFEGGGRLLTLHGPGGVGKTRLALQVAADHLTSPRFGDGVFFVPLDGLTAPAQLFPALAQAVGVTSRIASGGAPEGALADAAVVARALGVRRLLVVLDNFEHLTEAAPLLPRLLEACPHLSLLVTSRARLNLKTECVLTLDGLDFPEDASDPERALLADAVQLFHARAKQAQLGFSLGRDELPEVLRICRAVGGFPLALELAAAWTEAYPLQALASLLETSAARFETPHRDVRERHRSVGAAFRHSWEQLDPAAQRLLVSLTVFRAGFDLDAATEVAGATPEALARLADGALLRVNRSRYTFHPLLHQYLEGKLAEDHALERELRARHATFSSSVLTRLGADLP